MLKTHFLTLSLLMFTVDAFGRFPKTDMDFVVLPPYCLAKYRAADHPAEYTFWSKRLGHDFMHTHHYCAALLTLRIAQGKFPISYKQKQEKKSLLDFVFNNIQYMEEHAKPTYILFPSIYTTKAEAFLEIGKEQNAVSNLTRAIKLNKKFTRPYVMLSEIYLKHGKRKDAKLILEEGLKHSPNSKLLKKRLAEIK